MGMNDQTRRASDKDEDSLLKKDMIEALSGVADANLRTVLMIMYRSHESITSKLDMVLSDEEKIKHIVLNGYASQHDEHHRWTEGQMKRESEVDEAVNFVKKRHENGGLCEYASRMTAAESDNATSRRKVRDGVAEKIILAIIMLVAGALGSKYLGL
jgi:hypothetical protein